MGAASVADGTDDSVATLTRIRDQRFLSIAIDAQSIAWTENVTNPDSHATVGIYDLATRAIVVRERTAMSSVYQIAFSATKVYFATGLGVLESDRALSYEPRRFAPEGTSVDQIAVVGDYLVYRNFDPGQTVTALDLAARARMRVSGVTRRSGRAIRALGPLV